MLDAKKGFVGTCIQLTYQHSVLHAQHYRTAEDNLKLAKIALIALLGDNPFRLYGDPPTCDFIEFGGKIETYRVLGKGG